MIICNLNRLTTREQNRYYWPALLANCIIVDMMSIPLLTTKLYIPPVRPGRVPRPRLIARLEEGVKGPLTIISAPAGYGKTTLISDWVHENRTKVGWLSLDESDNEPDRFLCYLIHAIKKAIPEVGDSALKILQDSSNPPIESAIISLLNELVVQFDRLLLVLDDYHCINNSQAINQAINFLVDHQPPELHLFIATRVDPSLPLARWRACGKLVEIRTNDLRFTIEEATSFLNNSFHLSLSAENIAALEARTEGWIAGLQMAALSLRSRGDPTGFMKEFSSSHRFVMDYLLEEVLNQQSAEIKDFLLRSSVVNRLSGSLCDFLTGNENSQSILEQLDQANLFIVPLDNERVWYRYHDLFAQLLQKQVSSTAAELLPELHRRASCWYEREGLISEAIGHTLAGSDIEGLERLIQVNSLATIFHGELKTVLGWLEALPKEVVDSRPWLSVEYAWVLACAGELEAAELYLQRAEKVLADAIRKNMDGGEVGHRLVRLGIYGQIDIIRAYLSLLQGDLDKAEPLAREALVHLREEDFVERSFAAIHVASALVWSGDLLEAARMASEAVDLSRKADEVHIRAQALGILAGILVHQGKLNDAYALCQEALQLSEEYYSRSGRQLPVMGLVYSRLSTILLRRNNIESAVFYAMQAVKIAERWQQADVIFVAYWSLIYALLAQGDQVALNHSIKRAGEIIGEIVPYRRFIASIEAEVNLLKGDLDGVSKWAMTCGLSANDEFTYGDIGPYTVLARVLTALALENASYYSEAEKLVNKLLFVSEKAGSNLSQISALTIKSVLLYAIGDVDRALHVLEQALVLSEPEGIIRNFVILHEPMQQLLLKMMVNERWASYARLLLDAIDRENKIGWNKKSTDGFGLKEPLSERELQILRLLPTSRTRSEIAQELYISINTLRTHLKNIYGKLGVNSRQEAIQRGQELKLLE
jgi:LuxR family maltose regulon positive regulatory protein